MLKLKLTSPGDLPWGATSWGYGSWGNIGGMEVSQGAEEEATSRSRSTLFQLIY
jgi:hypothetical protein